MTIFILVIIVDEVDLWFRGFVSYTECKAFALTINTEWWACISATTN